MVVNRWRQLVLLFNIAIGFMYVGLWFIGHSQGLFWRADFTAFYTAWTMVRSGVRSELYDFALQSTYQQQILNGRTFSDGLLPYVNPPHATLLFMPLAWLSLPQAFYVWTAGQIVLLVIGYRIVCGLTHEWKTLDRWICLTAILAFPPMLYTFMRGTFSLLILVCILGCYRLLYAQKPIRAGIWLALATLKPQLALFPAFSLFANDQWVLIGTCAMITAISIAISAFFFGSSIWFHFFQSLQVMDGYYDRFGVAPSTMYTFKGTLTLILGNENGRLISHLSTAAFISITIGMLLLWRKLYPFNSTQYELRTALTLLLGLLFSPHLHVHDALLFIAPMIFTAKYLYRDSQRKYILLLFTLFPMLTLLSEWIVGGMVYIRIPTLMMGLLAIWLFKEIQRAPGA